MATWPSSYATIDFYGFTEVRAQNNVVRTDMEAGPPKQRRVATKSMVYRDANVYLNTWAAYNAFVAWHRDTILHGTSWFDWTDPVDNTLKSARIVGGTIRAEPVAPQAWMVHFTLETWD